MIEIENCIVHFYYGTMPVVNEYELNYPYCLQKAKRDYERMLKVKKAFCDSVEKYQVTAKTELNLTEE